MAQSTILDKRRKHWLRDNTVLESLVARANEFRAANEYHKEVRQREDAFNARFGQPSRDYQAQLEAHKESIAQFYASRNNVDAPGLFEKYAIAPRDIVLAAGGGAFLFLNACGGGVSDEVKSYVATRTAAIPTLTAEDLKQSGQIELFQH